MAFVVTVAGCGTPQATSPRTGGEPGNALKAGKTTDGDTEGTLAALVDKGSFTLFDAQGRIVAQVKTRRAGVGPKGLQSTAGTGAALEQGTATLFRAGKPVAVIRADQVSADQKSQVVIAKGDVVARSLKEPGAPALRADVMTWQPKKDQIQGKGNVLITRTPDLRIPGASFVADTAIRKFTVRGGQGSEGPASARIRKGSTL